MKALTEKFANCQKMLTIKSFFQICEMQLTDEPDKRCYPLGEQLLCRSCHVNQLVERGYKPLPSDIEVS